MSDRTPKFTAGEIVRIADPDRFIVGFGNRVNDRDAVVLGPVRLSGPGHVFDGRIRVEFQKRNGRGKVFTAVMDELHFVAKVPT